jgi:iron complex transport system substrate-binding protein
MRVCASLLAASLLLAAQPAGAAPRRVVSLNLCTDELLLLLAGPEQIASITHLAHQREEASFWRQARRYPTNDGSLLSAVRHRPDLVITMGGGGRDRSRIAARLRVPLLDLPYPQSLGDIEASVRKVASALERPSAGRAVLSRLQAVRRSRPRHAVDAVWLGGGGRTVAAAGLAAEWMRLAGLQQRSIAGDRLTFEQLLTRPPQVLLRSNYRQAQYSGEQRWLAHPLARRSRAARTLVADGRRWTCLGPSLLPEVLRLRRALQR